MGENLSPRVFGVNARCLLVKGKVEKSLPGKVEMSPSGQSKIFGFVPDGGAARAGRHRAPSGHSAVLFNIAVYHSLCLIDRTQNRPL
jgi:hypothetical protein